VDLGIFDLVVVVVVGIVIGLVWTYNRRRDEGERLSVPTEVISAIVVALGALAILAIQSGVVARDPVLFAVAVTTMVTLLIGVLILLGVRRVRRDVSRLASQVGVQVAGIGNLQFFPSKAETFDALTAETIGAKEKLIATRFSPADITTEDSYWGAIRQKAMDPHVLYVRIHSLAHPSATAIDGVCRLISELRGAPQFRLAIALYNNSFELILSDEKECVFCFHDLEMTIRNGFRVDRNLPSSAQVVDNFGSTLRRMIDDCYIVVDFGRWVRTAEDADKLQAHLRAVHARFKEGKLPDPIHPSRVEAFLQELFSA